MIDTKPVKHRDTSAVQLLICDTFITELQRHYNTKVEISRHVQYASIDT